MTLAPGTRVGPYEILALLGAGGMGEVYRAVDPGLQRQVALKILPAEVAGDPERLARFRREAQLLAVLNHPGIAAIHGLEQAEGRPFLVLELVEGEDLARCLKRGPLPADEALAIARQVAEAVAEAHARGIVHRDLKPANIIRTPAGKVKVLDFGLARAYSGDEGSGPKVDMSRSPTLTRAGTQAGVILGTAAYMSPEQARGKPVDKRTDVWAFGCVLYEMLAGRPAFGGDTVSDTLAAVLRAEPDLSRFPEALPASVRLLVKRCLEKDPDRRLHDISDARIEIEDTLSNGLAVLGAAPTTASVAAGRARPWSWAAALLGVIVAGLLGMALGGGRRAPPPVRHLLIEVSDSVTPSGVVVPESEKIKVHAEGGFPPALAFTPDGSHFVFVGGRGRKTQLYLRALDQPEPAPIPGTENGYGPFVSPSGRSLGFFADGKLKKVAMDGGTPISLADARIGFGTWAPDDSIYFKAEYGGAILRIPAGGGSPQVAVQPDKTKGEGVGMPHVLPTGKALLFHVKTDRMPSFDDARIMAFDLGTGTVHTLGEAGMSPRYLPSGHIAFVRHHTLFVAPFDPGRLAVLGPAVAMVEGVTSDWTIGKAEFSVAGDGSLLYLTGRGLDPLRSFVWMDRQGRPQPVPMDEGLLWEFDLSPDGQRAALTVLAVEDKIWTYDFSRGTLTRLTFGGGNDGFPRWTPDGRRVAFRSDRENLGDIFWKNADGSGPEEKLLQSEHPALPGSWTPDGTALAFEKRDPETRWDIWILPINGARAPRPFLRTPYDEAAAAFSPDGRWLAYESDESGRVEVYVRPYPEGDEKIQISAAGGTAPRWAPGGRELFFFEGLRVMAVGIDPRTPLRAGVPRLLFEAGRGNESGFAVSPDGQRFLLFREGSAPQHDLHLVLNWFEEVRRRAPSP